MPGLPAPLNIIAIAVALTVLVGIRFAAARRKNTGPLGTAAGYLIVYLLLRLAQDYIPADYRQAVDPYYRTALLLVLAMAITRLVVWMAYDLTIFRRRRIEVAKVLKDLTVIVFYLMAVVVILRHTLNINLASLIATSAVVTIIIGLALQETLANMFAGLSLQAEKPYDIGDWIQFDQYTGMVTEVSWRSTVIRTIGRDQVTIPNSVIAKSPLINHSRPTSLHARLLRVGVHYDVPPNAVKETLLRALRDDPEVSWEIEPEIRLVEYGDFAVNYEMRFFINDYARYKQIEDRILTRVWYHLKRAGMPIPFPIRDVFMRQITDETEAREARNTRARVADALKQADFLSPLSNAEFDALAARLAIHRAFRGETIIRQGEPGDSCFIIRSGQATVLVAAPEGEQAVSTLGPGQVFGEMSLMTGVERTATVRALTDMEIIRIGKDDFAHILSANPDIAVKISAILARRHLELDAKRKEITEAGRKADLESRTSHLIAKIKDFFGI